MSRHWYRVEMVSGSETYCFFGSALEDPGTLLQKIQGHEFVLLEDLIFYDEDDEIKSWSEWDPTYLSKVFLNPQYIINVMPMAGDPRHEEGAGSKVLQMPKGMFPGS